MRQPTPEHPINLTDHSDSLSVEARQSLCEAAFALVPERNARRMRFLKRLPPNRQSDRASALFIFKFNNATLTSLRHTTVGQFVVTFHKSTRSIPMDFIRRFMKEEDGATAVEYGIMVALIAAVIVGTVGLLGGEVHEAFQDVLTELQARL
ncbi:MAG: Flp family type IVb pilin [Noviherbaspirillum sp.]